MASPRMHQLFSSNQPEFDLILIHGLHGHCINSWSTSGCLVWARDLLPEDLQAIKFRLLTYQYSAAAETFQLPLQSNSNLVKEADALTAALLSVRTTRETLERPIIWLCHDLGGILLKQALSHYLWLEINDPASRPDATWLSKSTHGIMFFGTPHQSTLDPRDGFLDRLNRLYRLTTPTAQKQKLSGSASLPLAQTIASVNRNFEQYWLRYRICLIRAELPSYALQRSTSVFSESSSAPYIPGTKRLEVQAEHCAMTQFPGRNESYLATVAVLREYAQNACTVVSARWQRPISPRATLLMTDLQGRPGITDSRSLSPQTVQTGRPHRNPAPIVLGLPSPITAQRPRAKTFPQDSVARSPVSRNVVVSRMHKRMLDSSDDLLAEEEIELYLAGY